jgi:putative FmdB family regulatory protein
VPIYEYQCCRCSERFEKIQKFSDPELTKCIKCGGKVERLLSASAIQFKGAGWYVTDYARKSTPAQSPAVETSKPEKKESSTSAPAQSATATSSAKK